MATIEELDLSPPDNPQDLQIWLIKNFAIVQAVMQSQAGVSGNITIPLVEDWNALDATNNIRAVATDGSITGIT